MHRAVGAGTLPRQVIRFSQIDLHCSFELIHAPLSSARSRVHRHPRLRERVGPSSNG